MNVSEQINVFGKSMINKGMALTKTRGGAIIGAPLVVIGSLMLATGQVTKATSMIGGITFKACLSALKMTKDTFSKKEKQPGQVIANSGQVPEKEQTIKETLEKSQEPKASSFIRKVLDRSANEARKEPLNALTSTDEKSKQNLNPAILAQMQNRR